MHRQKEAVWKKVIWLDPSISAFFPAIVGICSDFCSADLVCTDSDRRCH